MGKLGVAVGVLAAVLLAVFLKNDADLFLIFAKIPEANAFKDQVVWITGASSGIGAVLAQELTKQGAQVIISARRVDKLEEVAKSTQGNHAPYVLPLDVLDYDQHEKAYKEIIAKFGKIDTVVLNAGRSQRNTANETPFEVTRSILELNFLSVVHLTKIVLPGLLAQKSGNIVLMSSLSGRLATPLGSSYSASKFAMHGYFDALRSEIADTGVTVSIICPGPVESEIHLTTHKNPENPPTNEGKKMTTLRCVELILRGLYYHVDEMWISEHPFLLFTYLNTYAPWTSRAIMKLMGPMRAKILKEGGNIYDVTALFKK